jgi:Flp pilus assembly protein protease CpaA
MAAGGHTSGYAVTGVTISFTIVAAICTILRLYTRFGLNKMGGVDDVFIAIATVCSPWPALTTSTNSSPSYWQ